MDNSSSEFTLPPAPRGLCFDRNDFVKTNFSVDNFLAEHQNVATLETMRDDLGIYLKVLRLAMIELINKDYANFVNLSATLIGFDKAIEKIKVPLNQLNDEVLSVQQCLEEAMKELSIWLNQRSSLQKKKQLLKHYGQTVNCLHTLENILKSISEKNKMDQIALADRAAMQYNQLKYCISKCDNVLKPGQKTQFIDITDRLVYILNDLLFQFWNDADEDNLLKALITLNSLGKVSETEMLIRKQAVAPLLQDIINEPSLQRSKDGLHGIYERTLQLLDSKLKLLVTVMQHSKLAFLMNKYNFLVNCFWCEVESRIEINLSSIFAPGNPKIFYTRYNESMQFVKMLENCCSTESVCLLRNTAEYKSFQRRWNLPVYFQIRFQEIAGGFEATLRTTPTLEKSDIFILKETNQCWAAIQECWSDGTYIDTLTHKFWKLTLQILSRYVTWASSYCTQASDMVKLDISNINYDLIDNSINIYTDSQTLLQRLPILLKQVEVKLTTTANRELLQQSLGQSEQNLHNIKDKIRKCIVKELFDNLNMQLKQVSEIPRLYRKTNRSVPTKPCSYLEVVSKAIHEFNTIALKRLDNDFLPVIFTALFNILTVSYYKYVEDVLTSVQKTEDSLRRLKRIREMASPLTVENTGITDDDKIRLQLHVDVVSYGKLAESVCVDVNSVNKYNELYSMVSDAVKNIDIK